MQSKNPQNRKVLPIQPRSTTDSYSDFDFEVWAKQVKHQMIACLRKRGVR